MKVIDLRNELNKIIEQGGEFADVVFDTEGGIFKCHMVDIKSIIYSPKDVKITGFNHAVMLTQSENYIHLSQDVEDIIIKIATAKND